MEIIKYVILIFLFFCLVNVCEIEVKDVEYKKRVGIDNYFKEYEEDSLYFWEVFDGFFKFIKNRV